MWFSFLEANRIFYVLLKWHRSCIYHARFPPEKGSSEWIEILQGGLDLGVLHGHSIFEDSLCYSHSRNTMTLVMVGGIVLLLGITVVVLRALNRIDDVYSRLPHDRDLQELFRSKVHPSLCHVILFHLRQGRDSQWKGVAIFSAGLNHIAGDQFYGMGFF